MLEEVLSIVIVFKEFINQLEGEYGYTHFDHTHRTSNP